jgi:hypothetical protein
MTATDGHTIPNMKPTLTQSKFLHGPNRAGNCSACHDRISAEAATAAGASFPQDVLYEIRAWRSMTFASPAMRRAWCSARRPTTLTNFRDGDKNLHFMHVNREEKGRVVQDLSQRARQRLCRTTWRARFRSRGRSGRCPCSSSRRVMGEVHAGLSQGADVQATGTGDESASGWRCFMKRPFDLSNTPAGLRDDRGAAGCRSWPDYARGRGAAKPNTAVGRGYVHDGGVPCET